MKKNKLLLATIPFMSLFALSAKGVNNAIDTYAGVFTDSESLPIVDNDGESFHLYRNYYSILSNSQPYELRFGIEVHDTSNKDFYHNAAIEDDWTITLNYSHEEATEGYQTVPDGQIELGVYFSIWSSELYNDEYIFSVALNNVGLKNGDYVWIDSLNNWDMQINGQEYSDTIKILPPGETTSESAYLNSSFAFNYNYLPITPYTSADRAYGENRDSFEIMNYSDEENHIIDGNEIIFRIKLNNITNTDWSFYDNKFPFRIKLLDEETQHIWPFDANFIYEEEIDANSSYFYYETKVFKSDTYTTEYIDNTPFLFNIGGGDHPESNFILNEITFTTNFENPYIESGDFKILSTDSNSIKFQIMITDTYDRKFYNFLKSGLDNKIQTTLINDENNADEIHYANYVSNSYNENTNKYTYVFQINDLSRGNHYTFYSLNNTFLTIGENRGIEDNKISLKYELSLSDSQLVFDTTHTLLIISIVIAIVVLINILFIAYVIYKKMSVTSEQASLKTLEYNIN